MAAREQEQRELEESLDVVRTELSRTEQARKDASIKVGPPAAHWTPLPGSEPSQVGKQLQGPETLWTELRKPVFSLSSKHSWNVHTRLPY